MNRLYADEIFTPTEVTRKYQYQLEDSRDGEYELPVNARRGSDGLIEDETTGKGISLKDYVRFTTGDVDFHERYNESFSYNRSTDRGTGRYTVKIYMKKGHTDSDYLGYGYWSDRLRIGTDYGHIGVFAHGSDPYNQSNLISLTGTATYRAPVQPILVNASDLGFYNTGTTPQQRHNAWRNHILTYYDGIKDLSEIYGNVNLTVNFNDSDSLGSIEGSMNFRVTFFND